MNKNAIQGCFWPIKRHGFTLIELLVVILIIGILAAVALPQYQQAVLKARFMNVFQVVQNIKHAAELYYLEHGSYKDNLWSELDIDYSKSCQGHGAGFICEGGFFGDINPEYIALIYDPTVITEQNRSLSTSTVLSLFNESTFSNRMYLTFYFFHTNTPNKITCGSGSGANKALCEKLIQGLQ